MLDAVDLSKALPRAQYDRKLGKLQVRMRELEFRIFQERIPVVVCFEGWDAAGKGGAIKRLTQYLDPRGYSVIPVAAPSGDEKTHHYMWRFWKHLPKAGHIAIFDRSWYGRVLVERVEGFCSEADWQRAYREINEFERQLHSFGTVICKLWLHISPDEQLRRFEERQGSEFKNWKLTSEDWRNREKRDLYVAAVDELVERTSTTYAPWTVIEANDKCYARVKVLKTVADSIAARL